MGACLGRSAVHRQRPLRAIKRLDLALRVPAKHQRLLRGGRIEDEGAPDAPGQTGRAACSPFAGLCDDAQRSPRPTGPPHNPARCQHEHTVPNARCAANAEAPLFLIAQEERPCGAAHAKPSHDRHRKTKTKILQPINQTEH